MAARLLREVHLRRLALVEQGWTARKIADSEGVLAVTVRKWARRHRITLVDGRKGRAERDWLSCLKAGLSANEAAKKLNASPSAAHAWAKRRGFVWSNSEGLTEAQEADVRLLMQRVGYSREVAVARVVQPKPKVPLMVPKSQVRALLGGGHAVA